MAQPVRKNIIEMITEAKSGHPGGSLSAVEIPIERAIRVMPAEESNAIATNAKIWSVMRSNLFIPMGRKTNFKQR